MDDGPITVMAAPDLPQPYEQYVAGNDSDTEAVAVSIRPRRMKPKPLLWIVDIGYSVIPGLDTGLGEISVTSYTPDVRVWFIPRETLVEEARLQDYSEDYVIAMGGFAEAVVNSAGDPYKDAIMGETHDIGVEISRNEWYYDLNLADTYRDTVNNAPFWGRDRGTVRMVNIGGQRKIVQSNLYWNVTYELHIRSERWGKARLDQGTRVLCMEDGSQPSPAENPDGKRRLTDALGTPVVQECLLDGHGQALAEGADEVYRTWHYLDETPFDLLNLPTPASQNILVY